MIRKKLCWFVVPVTLLFIIIAICVWNKNRPKSMWETNCNKITIQTKDNTITLNWRQRNKVIQYCEEIDNTIGYAFDEADIVIDFHNDIVVLYIDTETNNALAKVCAGESKETAYNYHKLSDEFIRYIYELID